MKVAVYNTTGEKVKEMDLEPKIFDIAVKPEVIQQAVVAQQANARKVLAHAKDRSEVSGGGRKPWRQKGTGRARHGSIRSPLWRGGGATFGPTKERNFSLKINKKVKRKAILMGLADKANNQKIVLLDKLELAEPKTKKFFEILQNLKLRAIKKTKKQENSDARFAGSGSRLRPFSFTQGERRDKKTKDQKEEAKKKVKKVREKSVLVVLGKKDDKVKRAGRNIPRIKMIQADSLNIVDILKHQFIVMPIDSLEVIKKTFVKVK